MRDLMEKAGIQDIVIETDERGLKGTGKFPGSKADLQNDSRGI
jgi:hypothetical protein